MRIILPSGEQGYWILPTSYAVSMVAGIVAGMAIGAAIAWGLVR